MYQHGGFQQSVNLLKAVAMISKVSYGGCQVASVLALICYFGETPPNQSEPTQWLADRPHIHKFHYQLSTYYRMNIELGNKQTSNWSEAGISHDCSNWVF